MLKYFVYSRLNSIYSIVKITFTCFFVLFKHATRNFLITLYVLQPISVVQCCYRQIDLAVTQLEFLCSKVKTTDYFSNQTSLQI